MRTFRVALVGYGLGGSAFHAPFLATTPGLELAAVVTGNPERQAAVQERHPSAEVLPSPDALWRRADEFDLAVITTPNREHAPLARTALERGLAVVVDKPFAATSADAAGLAELADARGLLLSVFHNRRWDGDFLTVRRLVEEGRLGRVHRFESRFERWRPEVRPGWKESADPADAGGILFDLGSHLIDQAVTLFGRPSRVYAEVSTLRGGAVVDDDAFVALHHAPAPGAAGPGVVSHLWMSALAADLGPRFRVLGDEAAFVKHGLDPQEAALRAGETPGGPEWGAEPPEAWGRVGAGEDVELEPTDPGAYQRYYAGVAEALATGGEPPVSAADGVAVLEVIEAARRSAEEGRVVTLPA
ncbi:putative dehydrogenase [Streptoalloteichus tenebrarius]|uniref:Dehydrogenase n=1 Tax=Streptoalloteichus tenebrarius (strain ATCC 17920 / DSM 40477 / JCM 4838 / CBS 697.72 / NBRC 16177 / NCIMB 11028 / NRRL B-12390 / A12253. 1 / ISP 5477) TaxID=1933 RepID=A0ABT1HT91_STRSD|nr:Gfo/Idh/MocA family oxidoreductase [Streptoalloteichus tenebrarius]MCP2258752.1 putative dehydrogenase [Streptoalloteichus tenebrarius]BFF02905.1 Gfo/Idh/MocA family oxidoreductase [Streptoalloteichus tenebrarius]